MPSDPKITNHDEHFIAQILDFMEKNMDNTALTVDEIALHLSMSRTVFYKKVKSLFGVTPIDLVKDIRVKRSVQLIQSGMYSFSEIAYMSGFSDPNYFGKCFKKLMGVTPSKFKESLDQS
jgi:AraC-like DNA-binding protein